MDKPRPLMDVVRDYVDQCHLLGWRPVFTRDQYRAILQTCYPKEYRRLMAESSAGKTSDSIFGVPFIVDDTPRPPMRLNPQYN